MLRVGGRLLLMPMGTGHAVVTVHAKLIHYSDATYQLDIRVGPLAMFETAIFGLALVAAVAALYLGSLRLRCRVRVRRTSRGSGP